MTSNNRRLMSNKALRKAAKCLAGHTLGEIAEAAYKAAMELRREVRQDPENHPYFSDLEVFFLVVPDSVQIRVDCMRTDTVACIPPPGGSRPPVSMRRVRSVRMHGRNRYVLRTSPPPSGVAWLLGVLFNKPDTDGRPSSEREIIDFFKSTVMTDIKQKAGDAHA